MLRYAPPLSGDCWPPQGFLARSGGPSWVVGQFQVLEGEQKMYVVHTGVHVTRRKQMNVVSDDAGDVCWTGASIYSAFEYLLDAEVYSFRIVHEGQAIRVCIGRVTD